MATLLIGGGAGGGGGAPSGSAGGVLSGTYPNPGLASPLTAPGTIKIVGPTPWADVTAYGAVGDGTTDDTAAIQAAIDAVAAVSGGTVFIPGTTGGFVVGQIKLKDRVNLVGTGWRSVLKCKAANAATSMVTLDTTSVNYTRIANLRMTGEKATQVSAVTAVYYPGGTGNPNHIIEHCFIQDFKTRGIDVATGTLVTRVLHNWVYACDGEGIYCAGADSILDGNVVGNSGLEGIVVAAFNIKSSNNKPFFSGQITAGRGVGIKVASTADNYMSVGDEPQDNLDDGFYLDSCDNAHITGGSPNNNAASACHIKAGTYHRAQIHAGGGERTAQTSLFEFETAPTTCVLEGTYNPASLGANPAISGTVGATNRVTVNGVAVASGGQTDRAGILRQAQGLKGENFSRYNAVATSIIIDGTVYGMLTPFHAGDVVTNIHLFVSVVAVTTTVALVGLYDTAGNRLAISADLGTAWESTGTKTHALSAPYTITTTGGYYISLICKAATLPTLLRGINTGVSSSPAGGSLLNANQTGQTTLPNPATLTAVGTLCHWVGWS